jgi:hypothetical protein
MNETTANAAPGRAELRAEFQAAQAQFHDLVARIGEVHWKQQSGIPAWTCGQLAWHVGGSVAFVTGQIEGAKKGKALNPPALLMPLLLKASELRVRIASRKATPASVLADFDAGMARELAVLEATDERELGVTVRAFGETQTLAELFRSVPAHVAEHAAHVAQVLGAA